MTVFKAYDVRAVYPEPLTEEVARNIGLATGRLLLAEAEEKGAIVVGHDMRPSSLPLVAALKNGILSSGADVIDVGLVDTPFIAFAVNHLGAIGGIQTTASHNPIQYNGFKICRAKAKPVGMGTGLEKIEQMSNDFDEPTIAEVRGNETSKALWNEYREHVFQYLDPKILSGEVKIKAAIDASNGMAGTMVPQLFSNVAGLELVEMNFENDKGVFVHEPNPLVDANLQQTRDAVLEHGCDIGICFDGDADRCMVIDEQGAIVGCDLITAWLSPKFLAHESDGGSIVFDLRSSHAVANAVSASGGESVRSRVGHVFMKQAMAEHDAPFGGELSGHFYFRDNFYADSGAMAFAAFVSALASSDIPLSAQIEPLRTFCQSGEINFETPDKEAAMAMLVEAFPDAKVNRLDGVTLELDSWWCNVRASNTEPLLRLNLEASTSEEVASRVADVSPLLGIRVDH
ncbi:MAG: phosphomannomutase/phosphoglucomutase [Phycisphaerales bacterium]|nr:phosphomannomutase/phosphoglucomutase [Planctomycetota bacterium]MBL6997643.1 phosphomannomutase/phosphoglucomutase [Phycisphaerales bacterium]